MNLNTNTNGESASERADSLKIYLEDGKIKIQGTINLGYIGLFRDSQIEIEDSLEEIRDWYIVEDYFTDDIADGK